MEIDILSISSDDETIIEPEGQNLTNDVLPERDKDLDYLLDKYLGRKKNQNSEEVDAKPFNDSYLNKITPEKSFESSLSEGKVGDLDSIETHRQKSFELSPRKDKLDDFSSNSEKSFDLSPCEDKDLDYLTKKYLKGKDDAIGETNRNNYETESFKDTSNESSSGCSNHKRFKITDDANTDSIFQNIRKGEVGDNSEIISAKEKLKLEKERLRQEKLRLREQKKEEDERNKAIKNALNNHYKNMRPENCTKFIKVEIDETLQEFSTYIIKELENNGISHVTKSHVVPSIITWKMQLDSHILDSFGQLIDASSGAKAEEVLVVIKWNDFLMHVHNQTYNSFIENLCIHLAGKKIIIGIFGLEKYYQYQKRQSNREFKQNVTNEAAKKYPDQKKYGSVPAVSRRTVEYALTEVQLFFSISHKMIESEQDLAVFVFQITKSIAQAPHKKEKLQKFADARWFMAEDKRNCVRVDKNGNGLSKLWKQVITTFPKASLETAEAIAAVYPTPSRLFQAYEKLSDTSDGEKLLKDIPIRRAAGPITTMRKIGPELSRKIYNSFTSLDPKMVL